MPVSHVVLVHGYSVRNLNAYANFPALRQAESYANTTIFLSAFNSLDDAITCDDLAVALEDHLSKLEAGPAPDLNVATSALVCHSTGALVTRRWILNRLAEGKSVPSHLITLAGANHGSTLAQLGETMAAHVFRKLTGNTSVGSGVLTDLDYGSKFLLKLNREWLEKARGGILALYAFSMGGDSVGDWTREIIWQTREPGSDSTVRISGANLNYVFLDADADNGTIEQKLHNQRGLHLVLPGSSHTERVVIIDSVTRSTDAPFAALIQALHVDSPVAYDGVVTDWQGRTSQWITTSQRQCHSTVVFSLRDRAMRPIDDSFIVLGDSSGNAGTMSGSLVNHPIQNNAVHSSVSFYLNYPQFAAGGSHKIHVEARSGSDEIDYQDVDYTISPTLGSIVEPI